MALDSINKITIDVSDPLNTQVVHAVQEDIRSRFVEITLVRNGEPLDIPVGAVGVVGLRRPNDTYVLYDTDEDGNAAVTFDGNVATCYLRQEALAMAGSMYTSVSIYSSDHTVRLTAFHFMTDVDATAVPSDVIVEHDYINIFQAELDEINTLLGDLSATATTLPAGSDATASYSDGVFSFGIPQGETGGVSEEEFEAGMASKAPVIIDSASGDIVSIPDGAGGMDARSVVVAFSPIQEGSGDPSPINVRPISGRTGLTVTRTGKNLWGGQLFADAVLASCTSAATQSGNIVTLPYGGSNVQPSADNRAKMFENQFQAGSYTIIIGQSDTEASLDTASLITAFYTDGTSASIYAQYYDATKKLWRWVSNSTKRLAFLRMNRDSGSRQEYDISRCGIFKGDVSVTDFAPYAGTAYPVTWQTVAGTVYSGTLDVVSGVLTVTHASLDLGTRNWTNMGTYWRNSYNGFERNDLTGCCERYKVVIGANVGTTPNSIGVNGSGVYLYIHDEAYSTPEEIKAALNGVLFVAKLATPQTYQLTPTEVEMFLGSNNVFSDGGNVSLTYPCDTKLYIEKLTRPTEDDMVANANIPTNTFFMVGNRLFKSTAAIAQGAAIVVGTNCTALSLADALNALN